MYAIDTQLDAYYTDDELANSMLESFLRAIHPNSQ